MRPVERTEGRASTGVEGLDEMLGGGLLRGDATLVAGSPGTGKTTLGLHFTAAGIEAGESAVFVTFEYLPQQIYRDARAKGWDLQQWEREGRLRLICTTPEVLLASAETDWSVLDEAVRETGASRIVIDSMTHFQLHAAPGDLELRSRLAGLMNHLRLIGVTAILTHEVPQIVGPTMTISSWGLEFLVDTVILLRYVELEGELTKAINVLKFRGSDHDRRYRLIELTRDGMRVESTFAGVENISGGNARRLATRARDLI